MVQPCLQTRVCSGSEGEWCPVPYLSQRKGQKRSRFHSNVQLRGIPLLQWPILYHQASPEGNSLHAEGSSAFTQVLLLQLKLLSAAGNAVVRYGRFTVPETVVKFFLTFPKPNCVNETARQEETHGWRSLLVFVSTQNIPIYVQNIILQYVTNSRVLSKNDYLNMVFTFQCNFFLLK